MTNNTDHTDEFDPDGLGTHMPQEHKGMSAVSNAWRTKPFFKLMVIVVGVGVAIAIALSVFSGPEVKKSDLVNPPTLNEPPGSKASPYFNEQNTQASIDRAQKAAQQGTSAMPTPTGESIDINEMTAPSKTDPLQEFRAETERLKQEQLQTKAEIQQMKVQAQQPVQQIAPPAPPPKPFDDSLAQAMQRQMQQLNAMWTPTPIKVVNGVEGKIGAATSSAVNTAAANASANADSAPSASSAATASKLIVQAGTVNYAQLLIEANSDVPGTILAQVLSGPLSGGRAIGQFKVMNDYLLMHFSLISFKGKDYPVDVIALDPDTTLGGMATEVNHRYVERVLLPAAASFISSFGSSFGSGGTTQTATANGILSTQAKQSFDQALFTGMGQSAQTVGQFFQDEAKKTLPLVKVATGTPIGLFFIESVKASASGEPLPLPTPASGSSNGLNGYGQSGYGGQNPYLNNTGGYAQNANANINQSGYGQTINPYGYVTGVNGISPNLNTGYNNGSGNVQNLGNGATFTPYQSVLGNGTYGR